MARMAVDDRGRRCGQPTTSGGTRGMFATALVRPSRQGIELLPRPPATESGTARRRGSERHEPACRSVAQRLGDEAAGTREAEPFDRSRHRHRSPRRALATHTRKGPSPFPGPAPSVSVPGAGRAAVSTGIPLNCGNPSISCGQEGVDLWTNRRLSVEPAECGRKPLRDCLTRA